jgi:ATP-dependent Clp protease ATP-binding subunit ClpC
MKTTQFKDNSLSRISSNLARVMVDVFNYTRNRHAEQVNTEDMFLAIITNRDCLAAKLLERLGVDLTSTKERIISKYANNNEPVKYRKAVFGQEAKDLLSKSFLLSNEMGHVYVGTEHLLLAIMQEQSYDFIRDLASHGLNYEFVKQSILNFGIYQPGVFAQSVEIEEEDEKQKVISFFTKDMNKLAEEGRYLKVWGRDDEIERIIHILSRRTKNNALLIGEAGVGKTAVVEGLAQRLLKGQVPPSFKNKKIVQLDISAIIAGSKIRGDVEERLLGIISEMADNPDLIIFIDEIHMIVGAGAAGSGSTMDVANIIKPYLTNGDLRVIGSTTFDEYQKYIEEDDALARRFQTIFVNEIDKNDAIKVLEMLRPQFEDYHHVKISDRALIEAVDLSNRYIANKYLPDKAIDVIDEAAAAIKIKVDKSRDDLSGSESRLAKLLRDKEKAIESKDLAKAARLREKELKIKQELKEVRNKQNKARRKLVDYEDIRKVVSRWSGVPVNSLSNDDIKKLNDLESDLRSRIIGQDHVIEKVAATLKRARIGLADAARPMSSFLFLGPTGVGKTQTAKEIAKTLFGSEDNLIQVDMSEYMEQHSVSKLIGSPPGYVGFQEGGQLTEKVRRKPYSVVLFDEIDKAHPDLLNILLQILDEGHIQDAKGRQVNLKNCVIIMTSNIGAWEASEAKTLGFNLADNVDIKNEFAYEHMKENLIEILKDTLPPEFINRIDEVLVFRRLVEKDAERIASLFISDAANRLLDRNIELKVDKKVLAFIAQKGFQAEYGARNLKRSVQETLENSLADYLMQQRIVNKLLEKKTVKVTMQKGTLHFSMD